MIGSKIARVTCGTACAVVVGLGVLNAQAPAPKPGQPTATTPQGDTDRQQSSARQSGDQTFVEQAAIANMTEIQLGRMAVQKSQNADVRKFGQMMIDDHTRVLNELKQAASGANIKWPTQLDEKHKQLEQRLSALSGQQFDREYMKAMVEGHREVEKMVSARAGSGGEDSRTSKADDRLKTRPSSDAKPGDSSVTAKLDQWAAKTLPGVRTHLKHAEDISGRLEKGA